MKKILFGIGFCLMSIFGMAQNGLESVIIEKYYVSNAADSAGSIGTLPVGSVTYRIYADMLPGYKFQALYGVTGHELKLTTTTSFFNNEDRGATTPNGISATNTTHNTVMLDSWFSVGATANHKTGVLKTEDTDGSIGNANSILANNDASAGIQILTEDGQDTLTPKAVTFVGLTTELDVFDATSQAGNSFSTFNGSVASTTGSTGARASNMVLLGQFTTNGAFHYELNIQIGTPSGGVQNFVAKNPVGTEISIPSLMGTKGGCTGAPAQPALIVPNITGSVCNGSTRTYSVAEVAGADVYNWTVPTGATINGASNTNFLSVTYGATFTATSMVSVNAANPCGTSLAKTLSVVKGLPATPGTISGSTTACPTSVKTYSVAAVNGVTYVWSHTGTTIAITDGAAPNNQVTVTYAAGFTGVGDTLKVQATNPCGNSAFKTLKVGPGTVPTKPAMTYSPNVSKICTGDGVTCTTTTVANSFTWSVTSSAVEIYVNGLNKHQSYTGPEKSVIVSFLTFTSTTPACSLTVVAHNECGDGLPLVKVFTNNGPTAPKTIALTSGILKVCPLDTVKVSIGRVANALPGQYLWTSDVPGAKIGSVDLFTTGFIGDTSARVNFTPTFTTTSIKISVKGLNSCGYGVAKTLSFTRNTPTTPASLTAQNGSIYGYCNTNGAVFIAGVSTAATDYVWAWSVANTTTAFVPANPTTTTATVNFTNFTSGSLTVKGHNQCGVGAAKSLALKGTLIAPLSIDGNPSPCPSTTETYSTNVDGASSYAWTVPANTTINGSKTGNTISLTFKSTYTGGNITAKGLNACGTGLAKTVTFTPGTCKLGENVGDLMSEISVYPNPAHDIATVNFNSTAASQYQLLIIDMTGREVLKTEGTSVEGFNAIDLNLSNLAKGIYLMNLKSEDNSYQKRIVVE